MKVRLLPRLKGVLLLAASGGTTLLHRSEYEAVRHGPAQLAEFALSLATFMLASTGMLLLIHGAELFRRDRRQADLRYRQSPVEGCPGEHGGGPMPYRQSRASSLLQSRRIVTAVYAETAHKCELGRAASSSRPATKASGNLEKAESYGRAMSKPGIDLETLRPEK